MQRRQERSSARIPFAMASRKTERCWRRSSNTPTSKDSRRRSSRSTTYLRRARWMYNSFGSRIASFGSVRSFLALGFFIIFISCRAMALAGEAPLSAEAEWERTVKAAEQEGEVVVYKLRTDIAWHAFQKRFPKIKLVLAPASAAQVLQRLMAERRAEKFLADVVMIGGGTSTSLLKAKALDPIGSAFILPEVKDPAKWFEGRHHYNDSENRYVFVYAAFPLRLLGYNTKSV